MIERQEIICTGCPMGCPVILELDGNEIKKVSGHECVRGLRYAKQEYFDPRRPLSTTVPISNALWRRLPVKTTAPIPKDKVIEAAKIIHSIHVTAPVKMGQVLLENILGESGIHVVATRSMEPLS